TLSAGSYTIKAVYFGDGNFTAGTGTLTQTVNQDATTTNVSSSITPSLFGQPVTFIATVTAAAPGSGTPSGAVQFQINGNNLGTPVGLNGGQATSIATTTLTAGSYGIKTIYSGDANFGGSTGTLTQTVNQDATTLALSSSAAASVFAQAVTFTATVAAIA